MKKGVRANRLLTAIDIGTTKISVLIGQASGAEVVDIIGIAKVPSHGLQKGVVVDVAKTVQSIRSAIAQAELMAGATIDHAVVGISGAHIQSYNSTGMAPIARGQIDVHDIAKVIEAAQATALPEGQQVLHVLPQYFIIDDRELVTNPLGMHGVRMETNVHIITGAVSSVQNLVTCCQMAGISVVDLVLEQLASADAVLTEDEKELGVGVIDIGGGTADFALYHKGTIRHTMVLPIAGNHFTHDVAIGLKASLTDAERIKREYGVVIPELIDPDMLIELQGIDTSQQHIVQMADVYAIVNPRARELCEFINDEIVQRKLIPYLSTGIVLTGGGSLLGGIDRLAHSTFGVPVRLGTPHTSHLSTESLSSPIDSTGYGLLIHTLKKMDTTSVDNFGASTVTRIFEQMRSWVSDFF